MLIRTLRPTEIAGRHCRAFACLNLPEVEATALIDSGLAEPWAPEAPPPAAAPTPAGPADQSE